MEPPRVASNAPDTPRPRRVMTAPVPASTSSQQSTPSSPSQPAASESDDLVETLYSHPSVRIISFTSSRRGFTTSLPENDVPPGSLPPSSRLERTIAVGAFRIYRAPGSVAFLSCGSALQPILPKSQCWCINEDNSRFVLQIRRPQYWRIEVPVTDPDDAHRAVLLRDVFDKILLFEKTECPFERSFIVELPDPETPVKKKAWTAEGKNLLSSPFSDLSPPAHAPMAISRGQSITHDMSPITLDMSPASTRSTVVEAQDEVSLGTRDQSFGNTISYRKAQLIANMPNDIALLRGRSYTLSNYDNYYSIKALEQTAPNSVTSSENITQDSTTPPSILSSPPTSPEAAETPQQGLLSDRKGDVLEPIHSDGEDGPASFEGSGGVAPANLARKRMTRMLAGRSFTTPAKSNEPVAATKESQPPPTLGGVRSSGASTDSFRSAQSRHSSVTSPLASPHSGESSSHAESVGLPESPSPVTYASDHITTPKNTVSIVPVSVSDSRRSAEPTPRPVRFITDKKSKESTHSEDGPRVSRLSTVEGKLGLHRRRSHAGSVSISRRALSPLPSAANLFTPPPRQTSQSRLAAVRRLPAAILHKTMEILLGPPGYLIRLMLKVAAMIMAGEWRGLVFGFGEAGEQIPVQWDYYSDGEFSDLSDNDDYTTSTQSSNYSDSVPRADVRRRTKWANDDDHDASGVD
ncbi:inheritance of peroxisomes protein 1-domain-containing protein [Xylaria acuta]|nr:inheritance of peroxisomes protein 1-domain-containing protein [Xylaria acuta]